MNKILNPAEATLKAQEIKANNQTIVLAGGCFDILHIGHIRFLEEAKKQGDFLFILLENDLNIQKSKGKDRPINNQQDRAAILSAISSVDYVITLPEMKNNTDYDNLVVKLNPDIIATTDNDQFLEHKERQAKMIGAKVEFVTEVIKNQSTSRIAKLISQEL